MTRPLDIIGIMTGNSLDAADCVLTRFDANGKMTDLSADTLAYPPALKDGMRKVRDWLQKENFAVYNVVTHLTFAGIVAAYTKLLAQSVANVLKKAGVDAKNVAAIGLHGQTCAHCPPSAAGDDLPYTVQIFHPKLLAKLTGIPVVYDFRSDDVFNGGEGAPFAPAHNLHMAQSAGLTGVCAFANAGNTGNLAIVDGQTARGFDCGPFNHFSDLLCRRFFQKDYDENGAIGASGKVDLSLLDAFFNQSARTRNGDNFHTLKPPKSSDPQWYVPPEAVLNAEPRTALCAAQYAAVYALFYNLSFVPEKPETIVLFGGGWNNPNAVSALNALIDGNAPVLDAHKDVFKAIRDGFKSRPRVAKADAFGLNATYTEARIFADAAYRFILNEPFTFPETTGTCRPTVCGVYCVPDENEKYLIQDAMTVKKEPQFAPLLYSRASKLHDV